MVIGSVEVPTFFFCFFRSINTINTYDIVLPQKSSARKIVGDDIIKPSYWKSGTPGKSPPTIEIKNETQIKAIKNSCRLASSILKTLEGLIKVGYTFCL